MDDRKPDDGIDDADFVIEEESEDLETAFREALEAVERRGGGNGSPATAASAEGEVETAEAPVSERDAMVQELERSRERLMRTLADFDNFRKRTERERSEQRRYEGFNILRELLGVVDNLERALESDGSAEDLKAGVELILRQMRDLLQRSGVHRIETTGEPFDPRVHEAMMRHEDPEVTEPRVDEEFQAGYSMRDRLLRPARVKVAMPPAEEDAVE